MGHDVSPLPPLQAVTLTGRHVRLEPLAAGHAAGLRSAVAPGELWKVWYTDIPSPDGMAAEIDRRLALQQQGSMLPFAIRRVAAADGDDEALLGMTSYMSIDLANRRVEIGSTWMSQRAQRGPWNTESKLLLLRHAFDTLGCIAVEWRTHFMNAQSRRAIERLGAKLDGVLRSHRVSSNGTLRDTAVYSVIASEWPTVEANLVWQLDKPRTDVRT